MALLEISKRNLSGNIAHENGFLAYLPLSHLAGHSL
jgi:hypothetical protein